MNQILITKKLYVTPELKRKKRAYKIDFIISVFLVIALISVYIYAEYDRSKEESIAKDILTGLSENEDSNSDDVMTIALNESAIEERGENVEGESGSGQNGGGTTAEGNSRSTEKKKTVYTTDGASYTSVGTVTIPSLNVKYPVLLPPEQTTESIESLLKVAPCKFWGPNINEVGNFCIVGHNYRNTKFFSKVPTLRAGDTLDVAGVDGNTITYTVYDKYAVAPTDVSCTSQLTNGRKEVTLITCTDDGSQRWIIKAREAR